MREIITVYNLEQLRSLVHEEIALYGEKCDLNHIDISSVDSLNDLFTNNSFDGNISNWNTSNIKTMNGTFHNSKFTGDISRWDTSDVRDMSYLFSFSKFNGDISKWDVSNVLTMSRTFNYSKFCGNLSKWNPQSLLDSETTFSSDVINKPYWAGLMNNDEIIKAIESYKLMNDLDIILDINGVNKPRVKI